MNAFVRRSRGLVLPILLIAAWEYTSRQGAAQAYAFVPLSSIAHGFSQLLASGELLTSIIASLQRTCSGLLIGALTGIVVGAAMSVSRLIERALSPLYHTLRQVPILGLIPLIALWFGSGEGAKVLIVSLAAFFPMVLNAREGFSHVDKRHLEVATVLELTGWQRLIHVQLPAAMPAIITGLLHALAFAWVSSVGSELFLSSGNGLGNMMMNAETGSRMDVVVIGVLCIGLLGYGMNLLFSRLGQYLLRWRGSR